MILSRRSHSTRRVIWILLALFTLLIKLRRCPVLSWWHCQMESLPRARCDWIRNKMSYWSLVRCTLLGTNHIPSQSALLSPWFDDVPKFSVGGILCWGPLDGISLLMKHSQQGLWGLLVGLCGGSLPYPFLLLGWRWWFFISSVWQGICFFKYQYEELLFDLLNESYLKYFWNTPSNQLI